MIWQLFIILFFVSGAAAYILRRSLAVSLSKYNLLVNAFAIVVVLYPLGLIVALFTNANLSIGWLNFAILIIAGCVFPLINLLTFRASKDIDAGLLTILSNIAPVITIITATILLNEGLSGMQLVGVGVILASAFLATAVGLRRHPKATSSGLVFAVVGVCLLGLAIVFERWMLTRIDFGAYLVFGWGAQALWSIGFAWSRRRDLKVLITTKHLVSIISFSTASALKGLFFVAALSFSGNASVVSAYSSFMPVLVVVTAYFVLREKESVGVKFAAAAIGAVGLIVLNVT